MVCGGSIPVCGYLGVSCILGVRSSVEALFSVPRRSGVWTLSTGEQLIMIY